MTPARRRARTARALRNAMATTAATAALAAGALLAAGCGPDEPVRASLSVAGALAGDTAGFQRADTVRTFRLPDDHGPHPGFRTEWWYFTGNLRSVDPARPGPGRRFGFQLTFFRSSLRPDPSDLPTPWATNQAWMAHFAVTDAAAGAFHAFERFERGALGLAGARTGALDVHVGDWRAEPADRPEGGFLLEAVRGDVAVSLLLEPGKPRVLQGDRGLSRKGPEPGNSSYYYSLTRMPTAGTVTTPAGTFAVEGLAWLDREWSTSALGVGVEGWDWFSIQLDDGGELMWYRLRREDGTTDPFSGGTLVGADGSFRRLSADDVALDETGRWTSDDGVRYPSGWLLRVPSADLELRVDPVLRDQELRLAFRYWEGAVDVTGRRAGRPVAGAGYVELTGYDEAAASRGR